MGTEHGNTAGRRRRGGTQGFTLVEGVLAAALLAGTVLSLTGITVGAQTLRRQLLEKSTALEALETEIEAVKATPFDQMLATQNGRAFDVVLPGYATPMLAAQPGDPDGRAGLVTVTVPDPPGNAGELLDVTLQIQWQGAGGPVQLSQTLRLSRLGAGS